MKRTYINEDNVFDIIKIGKKIRLYYDDFNKGTFTFIPYLFKSEIAIPLNIIDHTDNGCNGSEYEVNIKEVNSKYDIRINNNIKIENGKIISNIFWGLYLYGYDPSEFEKINIKNEFFDKMQFALYFSDSRAEDEKLYLCRGSGAERVFIK